MTDLLLRLFVKHASDTSDPAVRAGYGRLAGVTGIVCNLLLFALKLLAGTISGSVSITADAVNNLSDASGSIVTLVGFKLASRPADDEHPYGHARMEYLSGLAVAVLILVIGVELVKSSVGKILHPEAVEFSALIVVILVCSILVKLWMAVFNRKLGRRIGSAALTAAAADSRNDVIATSAVLVATLAEHGMGYQIDGFMGLVVSLFVLYSGISLARETISPLLGEGADTELHDKLTKYIQSCDMVIGCHDLMVHDYGPGQCFASIHVEIDKNVDALVSHEVIDRMERECLKKFDTHLVIHYDPVITDDKEADARKQKVLACIEKIDPQITLHDFRVSKCESEIRLTFDLVLPETLERKKKQIQEQIETELNEGSEYQYFLDITFDVENR